MDTRTENKTKGNVLKVLCSQCARATNHLILASSETSGSEHYDQEVFLGWSDDYQIMMCQGCETISFRHAHWFSEHEDPYSGTDGTTERLYPMRTKGMRAIKDYSWNVPDSLRRIYSESVEVFNHESYTLCAAGLRALVEGICEENGVKNGTIEEPDGKGGTKSRESRDLMAYGKKVY